jgi:lipopolysaccharide export system permease protein
MSNLPRWLPPLIALALGLVAAWILVPREQAAVAEHFFGFPDSHVLSNRLRPWILGFVCFMPAIATAAYCLGNTFDRYLARQLASIFLICFATLFGIWLLLDLDDNVRDFQGSENMLATVLFFYGSRLPAILLVLLPYALLLGLIQGLGKFSKSNEFIAMIQSGTGVARATAPLIFAGLWCSVLLLALNYQWAPHAEGSSEEMVDRAKGKPIYGARNVLYRDTASQRLWLVGAFPENFLRGGHLENVEVTTLNPDMTLESRISSPHAWWDRATRQWTFGNPLVTTFGEEGESPALEQMDAPLIKRTWDETPAQIIKPGLSVEYLGIPELSSWLASPLADQAVSNRPSYLTHWHYRWALPFTCLVTVILAAPLSIHFARRGSGSGIFLAVVLAVLLLFSSTISLSLGEAAIISPALAAWLPNIAFTLLGLWLYHRRVTGRPIYQSIKRLLTVNS